MARELIGVLDNLERAIEAAGLDPAAVLEDGIPDAEGALEQGCLLTYRDLRAGLGRAGVEAYAPLGEPFDPSWHEALQTRAGEGTEPGRVVEVMQTGYRLGDDRPAARPGGRQRVGGRDARRLLPGARRLEEGLRRGDQEGLPEARPRVPSRPQPGRCKGGGAFQAGPGGLRHPLRPREAQAVRLRRDPPRLRWTAEGPDPVRPASPPTSATSSRPSSAAEAASRSRLTAATSRPRSGSPSSRPSTAPRSR